MKYTIKGLSMKRSNKAISDIVAVVMLILIAIAAAVLIYLWLSGLVGSVHLSNPALTERISINAVVINRSSSGWNVTAYVLNSGSSPVTINALYVLNASNGATLFGGSTFYSSVGGSPTTSPISIPSNTIKPVVYEPTSNQVSRLSAGTPIIVEVTTTNGVQTTYQLTWP
jgi:flagellin-like protein